jgi:hypothetical protein
MPYVLKNASGAIIASSHEAIQSNAGWQLIDDKHPEYLAFLETSLQKVAPFRESDIHLARVLEDLITLLIERDLIRFTDFPEAAQKRLIERQSMRKNHGLISIVDDPDTDIYY